MSPLDDDHLTCEKHWQQCWAQVRVWVVLGGLAARKPWSEVRVWVRSEAADSTHAPPLRPGSPPICPISELQIAFPSPPPQLQLELRIEES